MTDASTPAPIPILNEGGTRHVLAPDVLVRIGGLPLDALDALEFEQVARWVDETLALERRLDELTGPLTELLFRAVKATFDDRPRSRALLALKRHVFNRRAPENLEKVAEVTASLDPETRAAWSEWLDCAARHRASSSRGQEILEQELPSKRAALKALAKDAELQKGMLLASPGFHAQGLRYLESKGETSSRSLRLAERTLLQYVFRATTKTSPFSSLTSVMHGRLVDAAPTRDAYPLHLDRGMGRSVAQLHLGVLAFFSAALVTHPAVVRHLEVRITPGVRIDGDRLRYFRRTVVPVKARGPALTRVTEATFELPMGKMLRYVLDLLEGGRSARLDDLAARLAERSGVDAPRALEALNKLVRIDFLVAPVLRACLQSPSPVRDLVASLPEVDEEPLRTARRELMLMDDLVASYSKASVARRYAVLGELNEALTTSLETLESKGRLPPSPLYEDRVIDGGPHAIAIPGFARALEGVAVVQRLVPVFDALPPLRIAMKRLFTSLFGAGERCTDVLGFFTAVAEDLAELYWDPLRRGGQLGLLRHPGVKEELAALDAQRRRLRELVAEARSATPRGAAIRLSRAALLEIAAAIPRQHPPVTAQSFLLQVLPPQNAHEGARPTWVLNQVHGGFFQMFSRFMNPLAGASARSERDGLQAGMRRFLESVQPSNAIFAEVHGGQDANLNLHPAITRHEILVPGERSQRPPEACLPLHELHLHHDAATDTLRLTSPRLGVEVIPLYLGSLTSGALADVHRLLAAFSTQTMASVDLGGGLDGAEGPGPVSIPRICLDDVVLSRARWNVGADAMPARAASTSDAIHILELARWRRDHGIPRRVFAKGRDRLPGESTDAKADGDDGVVERLFEKPMYVDFASAFSVALLERLRASSSGGVSLTEMLPGPDEQIVRREGRPYVTELHLDMCQIREGES